MELVVKQPKKSFFKKTFIANYPSQKPYRTLNNLLRKKSNINCLLVSCNNVIFLLRTFSCEIFSKILHEFAHILPSKKRDKFWQNFVPYSSGCYDCTLLGQAALFARTMETNLGSGGKARDPFPPRNVFRRQSGSSGQNVSVAFQPAAE